MVAVKNDIGLDAGDVGAGLKFAGREDDDAVVAEADTVRSTLGGDDEVFNLAREVREELLLGCLELPDDEHSFVAAGNEVVA